MAEEKKPPQNTGADWLGLVAVACFVLAGGFLVKLSIDSGWLTPARQLCLAAALGLGLIGAGLGLLKVDKAYAGLLPGAGVVILYLTVFAGHRYYGVIPFDAALALTSAVSGLCLALYARIRHEAYIVTSAVGAYLAPIALGVDAGAGGFTLYYFLLCSVAFAVLAVVAHSRALMLACSYLAFFAVSHATEGMAGGAAALFLGLQFVIFTAGVFLHSVERGELLSENEAWAFLPVLLLFYAQEYHYLSQGYAALAPYAALGFAFVLVTLSFVARKRFDGRSGSQAMIVSFAAFVAFHAGYLELLSESQRGWIFPPLLLFFVFGSARVWREDKGGVFVLLRFVLLAVMTVEYIAMLYHMLTDRHDSLARIFSGGAPSYLLASIASCASLWAALLARREINKDVVFSLLGAAHVLTVATLYRTVHDISSLAVSALWLFYAAAVLAVAAARKDKIMARSALFVLAFAAGKALLYDAASAPDLTRIFCLLLTGTVLYGCGLFLRRVDGWND